MKYHLDTIPVWDAYKQQSPCPLCILQKRMVVPVGAQNQTQILKLIVKTEDSFIEKDTHYVRFVPMVE